MSKPDYTVMRDGELLIALKDDASKWAAAFCQIAKKQKWSLADIDEGLMQTWFANVIEQSSNVRGRISIFNRERRNSHKCTGR